MENRVEGPTAVFITTTDPDTDPETRSRFFVTGVDESREQTRAHPRLPAQAPDPRGPSRPRTREAVIRAAPQLPAPAQAAARWSTPTPSSWSTATTGCRAGATSPST